MSRRRGRRQASWWSGFGQKVAKFPKNSRKVAAIFKSRRPGAECRHRSKKRPGPAIMARKDHRRPLSANGSFGDQFEDHGRERRTRWSTLLNVRAQESTIGPGCVADGRYFAAMDPIRLPTPLFPPIRLPTPLFPRPHCFPDPIVSPTPLFPRPHCFPAVERAANREIGKSPRKAFANSHIRVECGERDGEYGCLEVDLRDCRLWYSVDRGSGKISAWRYEGRRENCWSYYGA